MTSQQNSCSLLDDGGQEDEDDKEEVMAEMCYHGENYRAMQPSGADEEYYRKLN